MNNIRQPAVAGMFYPAAKEVLASDIEYFLEHVENKTAITASKIKAIIVPHAGYIYSGPVAASVYQKIIPLKDQIKKVILIGPSHRVAFSGIAVPGAGIFNTPLGDIPIDHEAISCLSGMSQVIVSDMAHRDEHSLEVQLPFLQQTLGDFSLIPLVVGQADRFEVAQIIKTLWEICDEESTLTVISTDLSHFHPYEDAIRRDRTTSDAITHMQPEKIHPDDACGCNGLNGMLTVAKEKELTVELVDLRNSGDTAGDKSRVVGYGSYVIY